MNRRISMSMKGCVLALIWSTLGSAVFADEPEIENATGRRYWAGISLFSFYPGNELATYQTFGGGGVGPGGSHGTGTSGKGIRHFNVMIRGALKSHRFLASVEVIPEPDDKTTSAQKVDFDLTDLQPRTLEIARDDDGREYRLNLSPSVIVQPTKQFKASELRLAGWGFPASPVIMNDQDYLGELSMSGGQLASVDIPAVAKVEFSLLHLKGAEPIGKLQDGVINITHKDGTTLRITNVKNGINAVVLPGGPYVVWVRWNKPTQSLEEYRQELKETIESLKKQVSDGDLAPGPGVLQRLEKTLDSGRVGLMNEFSLEGVAPADLVEPE